MILGSSSVVFPLTISISSIYYKRMCDTYVTLKTTVTIIYISSKKEI